MMIFTPMNKLNIIIFILFSFEIYYKEKCYSETNPLIQNNNIPQTIPFIYNIRPKSMYKKIKKNNISSEIYKLKIKENRKMNSKKIKKNKQKTNLLNSYTKKICNSTKKSYSNKHIKKLKKNTDKTSKNFWSFTINVIITGVNNIKRFFKK